MTASSGAGSSSGYGLSAPYPSYQSVSLNVDASTPCQQEPSASIPTASGIGIGRRLILPLTGAALLVAVSTICILVGGILIIDRPRLFLPSEYASRIQDNFAAGVPILGSWHNKIRAQSIAEEYRDTFLNVETDSHSRHSKHKKKGQVSGKKFGGDDGDEAKAPVGCEATILLLRHCEKESEYEHCNYVGYERAAFLPTLFGDGDERWPTPNYVFALNPGDRGTTWKKNFREVELILPLAEKANVTINAAYGADDASHLARHYHEMLKSGEACGKLAVVSWKHEGKQMCIYISPSLFIVIRWLVKASSNKCPSASDSRFNSSLSSLAYIFLPLLLSFSSQIYHASLVVWDVDPLKAVL